MAIRGVGRHQGAFNKIATDERFSGSIRALSACISLWLAANGTDRDDVRDFIKGAFNRAGALKVTLPEKTSPVQTPNTFSSKEELKTLSNVREALGSINQEAIEDDTEGEDSE